jgi:protein-tyrosine phosphatase
LKYAILFALAGTLLGVIAISYGGWCLILLWPAFSFLAIGLAYLGLGPRVFGKRPLGTMAQRSTIALLPYLLYVWFVWHLLRLFSREKCLHQLTDNLTIGRRLLPSEIPENVDVVIDLTCEFAEPRPIRTSHEYVSYPMLDGVAPTPQWLANLARHLAADNRHLYVHCAQGHGRTGLVAAALLLIRGCASEPPAAVKMIQSVRPQVRLSKRQMACLESAFLLMNK